MSHKLPLMPHHPTDIAAALFEDLLAELADARERIAHLTAANRELQAQLARPTLPLVLGYL